MKTTKEMELFVKNLYMSLLDNDKGLDDNQYDALVTFCEEIGVDITNERRRTEATDDMYYIK